MKFVDPEEGLISFKKCCMCQLASCDLFCLPHVYNHIPGKKFLTFPWKYANVTRSSFTFLLHNRQSLLTLQMFNILLGKIN